MLTAHPTEAKRSAVLELHRELYVLLFEREYGLWTATELGDMREAIKSVLERLWRSGELRESKPTVRDELDNMLHFWCASSPSPCRTSTAVFTTPGKTWAAVASTLAAALLR